MSGVGYAVTPNPKAGKGFRGQIRVWMHRQIYVVLLTVQTQAPLGTGASDMHAQRQPDPDRNSCCARATRGSQPQDHLITRSLLLQLQLRLHKSTRKLEITERPQPGPLPPHPEPTHAPTHRAHAGPPNYQLTFVAPAAALPPPAALPRPPRPPPRASRPVDRSSKLLLPLPPRARCSGPLLPPAASPPPPPSVRPPEPPEYNPPPGLKLTTAADAPASIVGDSGVKRSSSTSPPRRPPPP